MRTRELDPWLSSPLLRFWRRVEGVAAAQMRGRRRRPHPVVPTPDAGTDAEPEPVPFDDPAPPETTWGRISAEIEPDGTVPKSARFKHSR
jgi:hypothetical protein